MPITLEQLAEKKKRGEKIVMVTAYDCPTAQLEDEAGADAVLVGDSLGTNVLGYASEREVTMADMVHHTAAAARGVKNALLVADMPYRSANTPAKAEKNALMLIRSGARIVKVEGWGAVAGIVAHLTKKNIPVCAHVGYNPQVHGARPRVFGTTAAEARELITAAQQLEQAGAVMCVLEKVPEEVSAIITRRLRIPTVGIGSGRECDGQVLVVNDLLGMTNKTFRHAQRFMDFHRLAAAAVRAYADAVTSGTFPAEEQVHHIAPGELGKLAGHES
ncbi:MAG: 3-methyl-2-oxobutanoate hydroxymethyltransferase [Chitinispirillaceae bacterium]|jgi:3-methyl-2-oxobutanoate hydroxymethyltransferase|nr:3-methyl-2-oxobutanoate hydroxymethyltransferase [Chitinispirillaceae bacterium]